MVFGLPTSPPISLIQGGERESIILTLYLSILQHENGHLREEEGKDDKLHGERRQRRVSGKSLDLSASRRTDDDSTLPRTCQLVPFVLKVKCIF
jgi:hypothetical protein